MGVTSIAAGAYHTCVVADGGVLCWGLDSYGQAGPVNTVEEAVASPVKPQPGSVTGVTCGSYYTCAALADGGADCWGDNLQAELGNGNENQANSPVGVVDLPFPVATVSAGEATTCAFLRNATVACWGHGTQGELGSGTAAIQSVPSNVPGLNGAVSLSSGAQFSCVVQSDGGVTCWGFNGFGELANGTVPDGGSAQGPPLPVVGLGGPVAKIAAGGDHACALLQDGTVECWGNNNAGEVGTGSAGGTVLTPTRLAPLQGIADIAAGANHVCAVEKDGGAVECWGNNQFGQIGVGTLMDYPSPTPVPGVQGANAIFAGSNHTCVRLPGGSLECWGDNRYGQLGIGTYGTTRGNIDYVITPTRVAGLQGVTSACGGSSHTCAVVNGNVQCWGGNFDGQLGIGAPSQVNLPAAVP
jgi:alpha-tubulin suppressor-like RCC1 family protein